MLEGLVSLEYCTVADIEALAEVGVGRILCSISDPYSVSFKKDPVSRFRIRGLFRIIPGGSLL